MSRKTLAPKRTQRNEAEHLADLFADLAKAMWLDGIELPEDRPSPKPNHPRSAPTRAPRRGRKWPAPTPGASEGGTRRVEGNRKLRANSPRRPAKGRP